MFQRNFLLSIGVIALLSGLVLMMFWFGQTSGTLIERTDAETVKSAVLVATHQLSSGTLLRPEDMEWKEVPATRIEASNIARGMASEVDYVGAVTRRDFGIKEALDTTAIVRAKDRDFLSAVLIPGHRAVSIAVDEAQGASGLVMPGDRVDVILTQNLSSTETNAARKSVGETVLHDRRVIAVDRALPTLQPLARGSHADASRALKTVTLELTEREAEQILVAVQLGRVALSVRPLEGSGVASVKPEEVMSPVWASDVSPALGMLDQTTQSAVAPAGSSQKQRRQIEIFHGDKLELR